VNLVQKNNEKVKKQRIWILDTRATDHLTHSTYDFISFRRRRPIHGKLWKLR